MFSITFFHGSKLSWCLYLSYQVRKPILPCYWHRCYRSMFLITFFYGSKLLWCLYLSYQVRQCILSGYLQRSYRLYVFNKFFHGLKLSWCLYLTYQDREPILSCYLHEKKLSEHVLNNFFSRVKIIVVFVPKLSCPGAYITMLFT